jgi:hypothetical protein
MFFYVKKDIPPRFLGYFCSHKSINLPKHEKQKRNLAFHSPQLWSQTLPLPAHEPFRPLQFTMKTTLYRYWSSYSYHHVDIPSDLQSKAKSRAKLETKAARHHLT